AAEGAAHRGQRRKAQDRGLPAAARRVHDRVGRRRRRHHGRAVQGGDHALLQRRRARRGRHHRRGVGAQGFVDAQHQSPGRRAQARAQAARRRIQIGRQDRGAATVMRTALFAVLLALPLTALGDGRGLPGPDEGKELDGMQGDIARFENATKDFRGTVSHVVQQEYVAKRKQLMQKYQAQLDAEERDEKVRRESAIKLFEDFLAKYHNDDRWTPDAMFRLAELYFEKSNDEYLTATQAAQASGAQITPDYSRTISLYKDLITRFPNYRLIDGAYYLLGWCLGEMNKEGESLQAMRAL